MEERHNCKLCSRTFINGRALGGHMKSHFANFPFKHQNPNQSPHPQIFSLNSSTDSPPSPEPASSISDTSPEVDVAICLIMLSMEKGKGKEKNRTPGAEKSTAAARRSFRCGKCRKSFRSGRALFGHEKVCRNEDGGKSKIFRCPYCCKVFGSGQALGGHKRSHLQSSAIGGGLKKLEIGLDLNLPAPMEQDVYGVLSDAS